VTPPPSSKTHLIWDERRARVRVDGVWVPGFVARNRWCGGCRSSLVYHAGHDAYFCPACNDWEGHRCEEPSCAFCARRPARPFPERG